VSTKQYTGLSKEETPAIRIPLWERLWHRVYRTSPYTHDRVLHALSQPWSRLDRCQTLPTAAGVRFLVRVDDFPRWDLPEETFRQFDSILMAHEIQYFLGVTPCLAADPFDPTSPCHSGLTDKAIAVLETLVPRVEVAMHGLTHRTRGLPHRSEFVGMPPEEVEQALLRGLEVFDSLHIRPQTFIPPFNTIALSAVPVLARSFQVLCGGPESISLLGFRPSPSYLGGMLYLPSYPPAYGTARQMRDFVKRVQQWSPSVLVPLTLHWAWELRDNFRALCALCDELTGWTVALRDIVRP